MADGVRFAPSAVTVKVSSSPGKTIPSVGVTLSHVAPAVAVNEMGEPLVDNVMVCAAAGFGGALNVRVAGFSDNVEGAAVTFRVTGIATGAAAPVTVSVMAETYCATERLVGFTVTTRVAGRLPELRFTWSQKSVAGVVTVKAGVPELPRTEMLWDFGSVVAPD